MCFPQNAKNFKPSYSLGNEYSNYSNGSGSFNLKPLDRFQIFRAVVGVFCIRFCEAQATDLEVSQFSIESKSIRDVDGARGILICTEEKLLECGWLVKFRILDLENFQLIWQVVGLEITGGVDLEWKMQWLGDAVPDSSIDMFDFTDSLSLAPLIGDESDIQHRALVSAVDIDNNAILNGVDFSALILRFGLDENSMNQIAVNSGWHAGVLDTFFAFFSCAPCVRNCGGLLQELKFIVEECKEELELCMPCMNDPNQCVSDSELLECWSKYKDCDRRTSELAGRAAGRCSCIYKCGRQLLKPAGIPF